MDFGNVVFLLFAAIVIAILIVTKHRDPAIPLINFFASIIVVATLALITVVNISFLWYVIILFVIFLIIGAMIFVRKVSI